jgi:hypothetical protein
VIFYLGTHQVHWLGLTSVPLFVSRRTLCLRKSLPRAVAPWALDSGGFSELKMFGRWTIRAAQYAREVRRWRDEIGLLQWAAAMDYMCEPSILRETGLSVREHQWRTILSYLELKSLAPDLPWMPVVQGFRREEYLEHVAAYRLVGVDLRVLPVVGVGSICRRQGTVEAEGILRSLAALGLRLHGFGLKLTGLRRVADVMTSADSMAWSFAARRLQRPLLGCSGHKNCANCIRFALLWRDRVLRTIQTARAA